MRLAGEQEADRNMWVTGRWGLTQALCVRKLQHCPMLVERSSIARRAPPARTALAMSLQGGAGAAAMYVRLQE